MPNQYKNGNLVRLTAKFYSGLVLTDPTTVTLQIKDPAEQITTYTYPTGIVKDGAGEYHYDLLPAAEGFWYYRWAGTGTVVAADWSYFERSIDEF